jgi:hypothetical protein
LRPGWAQEAAVLGCSWFLANRPERGCNYMPSAKELSRSLEEQPRKGTLPEFAKKVLLRIANRAGGLARRSIIQLNCMRGVYDGTRRVEFYTSYDETAATM